MVGVIVMVLAAALVFGLMDGSGRAERVVRWIARKLRVNEERAAVVLARIAERLEQLLSDRQMLGRVAFWAALNWVLDAAALWVFLRAFGITMDFDALIIAFGIANLLAAIPITPGGLGYVDTGYIGMLVGLRCASAAGGARRRRLPVRPVLLPDPARRHDVSHAARRARGASNAASG